MADMIDVTTYSDDFSFGKSVPDLSSLEPIRGDQISIDSSKVYILLFFNTFYKGAYPVLEEMTKLSEKYSETVVFVAISTDMEREKVEKFLGKHIIDQNTKEQLRLDVPYIMFDNNRVITKEFCNLSNLSVMSCPMAYIIKENTIQWRQQFLQVFTVQNSNFEAQLNHIMNGEEIESNGKQPRVEVEGEEADCDEMSLF